MILPARVAAFATLLLVMLFAGGAAVSAADTGWTITSFDAVIAVQSDGRVLVNETINVDFGGLAKHGIFREIPVRYDWPADPKKMRVYELQILSVTDGQGRAWTYETSSNGANVEVKIGDADRTISGKQTYKIAYVVRGALNAFSDHDEIFWNATGSDWPVPILASSATISAPAPLSQTTCYLGQVGSRAGCAASPNGPNSVKFFAGRPLNPGEQLTVVGALRKGVVPDPKPILADRPRDLASYFDTGPLWLALAAFVAVLGLALVFWRWFTAGRDDPDRVTIVPEYEPPDKLRPAQIGVIVDESADTLDVTASIVDLAVRGYLTIAEIPKEGLFGKQDWTLKRTDKDTSALLPYEVTILGGLFDKGDETKLSALRRHFYTTLAKAERELYQDAVQRGWFPADPSRVRMTYALAGVGFVVLAGALAFLLGAVAGGGLVGIGAGVPAVALIAASPAMPRKTKDGAELARRSQGFRRYMEVAETDRQRFAEKEHLFTDYLPYAIVFRCVTQWAKAFEGIDLKQVTSSWYTGSGVNTFNALYLSQSLSSFSENVSTAIASTPGGSGSSGFGGGAGGGGGGGGGGSW